MSLQALLRRERAIVLGALFLVTMLAWIYVVVLADAMRMGGMDMPGFRMLPATESMMVPAEEPWRAFEFVLVFVMWTFMMMAMMLPSAAPMILLYEKVSKHGQDVHRFSSTAWFTCGYLLVWCGFAAAATAAHWAFDRALLLSAAMQSTSALVTGGLLFGAGLYQWTSLKDACLRQCQSPWLFIQNNGGIRSGAKSALLLGLRHGLYCVGCCWALMTLLFVGGVMNVAWIAGLSILVLAEKIVPFGRVLPRIAGLILIGSGLLLLAARGMMGV